MLIRKLQLNKATQSLSKFIIIIKQTLPFLNAILLLEELIKFESISSIWDTLSSMIHAMEDNLLEMGLFINFTQS